MADLLPMKVRNTIIPELSTDNFPVTHINLVQGSPHIVETIQHRNNIPSEHRTNGMIVTVIDGGPRPYSQYRLEGLTNADWILYDSLRKIELVNGIGIDINKITDSTTDTYTINTTHTTDITDIFTRLTSIENFVNNLHETTNVDIANIENDIQVINADISDLLSRVVALETTMNELLTTIVSIVPRNI
jgi:hypothetical protein